jgi:hypothetical protein
MTKFEPEVAYRILIAKYDRLRFDSIMAFRDFIGVQMAGHWYDEVFYTFDRRYKALSDQADSMWDVLDYLRTRIEEEQHDAV